MLRAHKIYVAYVVHLVSLSGRINVEHKTLLAHAAIFHFIEKVFRVSQEMLEYTSIERQLDSLLQGKYLIK